MGFYFPVYKCYNIREDKEQKSEADTRTSHYRSIARVGMCNPDGTRNL